MESTSLTKALCLLEATAGHPEGRSLGDLAAEVGLAKPTAHRLLMALTGLGYIERPGSGVYRQSTAVKRLVSDAPTRRLIEATSPSLHALHAQTQETVNLGVLRHDRVLYLEVLESTQRLRRVASRASDFFHTTALGRAMAACLPEARLDRLLTRARLVKRTPDTVTDVDKLRAAIVQARRQGYAIEADETDVGVTCIAAPILSGNEAAGAISVSVPSARATGAAHRQLVKRVREAAAKASRLLESGKSSRGGRRGDDEGM
jgi:DNA-binding IclR family transcriptional regulator